MKKYPWLICHGYYLRTEEHTFLSHNLLKLKILYFFIIAFNYIIVNYKIRAMYLIMYVIYPIVSILLGNSFPQMVTYIMPCPIISLSIAVYSSYTKKNKLLLSLLTIWGLTGVKSFMFNVYEDIILLICGIYCLVILIKDIKYKRVLNN